MNIESEFEKSYKGLPYSTFDMFYHLNEKTDKKKVIDKIKNIIEALLKSNTNLKYHSV